MSDTHLLGLIDTNLKTLNTAADLLKRLSAEAYGRTHNPYFDSSLGRHLRHILDHYLCFRRDFAAGLIDYDQRQRDYRLETDKDYAIGVINELCSFLEGLQQQASSEQPLSVLLCNDVSLPEGQITQSSLGRELQFLQGHSVHHYALMAAMLRFEGENVDPQFGVAPSTIVYEKAVKESA